MFNTIITFAAGAAVGVLLEKLVFAKMQEGGIENAAEALQACFGKPMIATEFTLAEAKDWIKMRKTLLVNGARAAVVKVNKDTMSFLGKDFPAQNVGNYLVLVIMTSDKQISDSLLVKYEKLDEQLEDVLAKGNGILVVKE